LKSVESVISEEKSINDYVSYPMSAVSVNVETTLTQAGVEGKSWYISYANWRVSGTAVVGATNLAITISDGATVIYRSAIPNGSINGTNLHVSWAHPIKITAGNSITYTIASPNNAGCVIYANMGLLQK
jgi:hypothetical protein